MTSVGKSVSRKDGIGKATGRTRYADDITFSSHQPITAIFEGATPPSGHFSPEILITALQNIFA